MTIYVIVENIPTYDTGVDAGADDVHECLCHALGYFTDSNLAEAEVEKHNKKWRLEYVNCYESKKLTELAEAADIYPLLDELERRKIIIDEDRDNVQDQLERYGYVPMNPANYQPKRIRGRKIV